MMQYGVKEQLDGGKSSMANCRDNGWDTKATQEQQKEDYGWIIFGEHQ